MQLNKNRRGRPEHLYTVPAPEDVCRVLNVDGPRWSSPIQHTTSREARMALYAAKITHQPGRYSNAALSRWFGVSINTLKAYERDLNIVRRAQYEEAPLAGWNLDGLPKVQMGVWLQTPDGRRYPTEAHIAADLLTRVRVSLVRQRPNFICTITYLEQQRDKALARTREAAAQANKQRTMCVSSPAKAAKTPT